MTSTMTFTTNIMSPSEVTTDVYHTEGDSPNWSNYSGHKVSYETDEPSNVGAILFFVITILFGTLGNGLVVLAFCVHSPLRAHSINVFMVHTSAVNLLISAVVNPIYITIYLTYINNFRTYLLQTTAILATMNLANVLSIYSLCAVAINRHLLITRPNTTFRTWCVPRKRIACVLVWIWLVAIAIVLSYFTPFFLLYYFSLNYKDLEDFFQVSPALIVPWFLPVLIVPMIHFSTLRAIKVHRKRMEGQSSGFGVDVKEQRGTHVSAISLPDRSSNLHRDQMTELTDLPGPSYVGGDEQNEIVKGQMSENSIKENNYRGSFGNDTHQPERPSSPACSFSTLRQKREQKVHDEAHTRKHGTAESELRLVKMMLLMYVVLIISTVPSIVYFIHARQKHTPSNLRKFAFIIPVYPAAMPYIFLWSNKNFRSGAAKIVRSMRKLRNGKVGP